MLQRLRKSALAQDALILMAVQASGYLIPLITLPYLARVLTPERFGQVVYAQEFIWYFVVLTDYGFNITATREIAIHRDDHARVSKIFSVVMAAKALLMAAGLVLMSAVVFSIPKLRSNWPLFYICYLTVAANVLFPLWLLQGLQKLRYVGFRDLASKLMVLAAVFVFVHDESDYLVAAAIQSGGLAISGFIGLLSVPFLTQVRLVRPEWSDIREAYREAWPVFASSAATGFCGASNVVFLGMVGGPYQVGVFAAAARIIAPLRGLVNPLSTAIYPHVSRLANQSREEALRFLRRYVFLTAIPFLLIGLGMLAGADILIHLLFGSKYDASIPLMRVMGMSPFLLCLGHCFATYFMLGFGYMKEWSRMTIASTVFNFLTIGTLLFLLPPASAAAWTMIAVDLFVLSVSYAFYEAKTRNLQL